VWFFASISYIEMTEEMGSGTRQNRKAEAVCLPLTDIGAKTKRSALFHFIWFL
jgi:hypothetical protein